MLAYFSRVYGKEIEYLARRKWGGSAFAHIDIVCVHICILPLGIRVGDVLQPVPFPSCIYYSHEIPHPVYVVPGCEPGALYVIDNSATSPASLSPLCNNTFLFLLTRLKSWLGPKWSEQHF